MNDFLSKYSFGPLEYTNTCILHMMSSPTITVIDMRNEKGLISTDPSSKSVSLTAGNQASGK